MIDPISTLNTTLPIYANPYGVTTPSYNLTRQTGYYPMADANRQNVNIQQYLPLNPKRALNVMDQAVVQEGLSHWWPKVFQSYATPMPEMLANPIKSGILAGGVVGGLTALFGALKGNLPTFGLIGLGVGALAATVTYFSRQQKNENVLDLMQRLPQGATRRDMLADPVYQKDLDRQAMAARGGDSFGSVVGAGLALSMLQNRSRSRD